MHWRRRRLALRRLFDKWFPTRVSIGELFRAAEYLWAAATARGADSDLAKRWAAKLCRLLKAPRADEVVAALRGAGGAECAKVAGYIGMTQPPDTLRRVASRGACPSVRAVPRVACKTVVGRRMKCTGMAGTVPGANPVPWVRCARLSGWFDDY